MNYAKIREMLLYERYDDIIAQGAPAVPLLVDALKDYDVYVRREAARVLGSFADATAVSALIGALKDSNKNVRTGAIWSLLAIGDARAAPAIADALKDRAWIVRWRACVALAKIAEKTGIDLEMVKKVLNGSVESVRKEGDPVKLRNAEVEAAGHLIRITNAAAKFRASRVVEDGVILVGELPKPPSGKIYRATREGRAMA